MKLRFRFPAQGPSTVRLLPPFTTVPRSPPPAHPYSTQYILLVLRLLFTALRREHRRRLVDFPGCTTRFRPRQYQPVNINKQKIVSARAPAAVTKAALERRSGKYDSPAVHCGSLSARSAYLSSASRGCKRLSSAIKPHHDNE